MAFTYSPPRPPDRSVFRPRRPRPASLGPSRPPDVPYRSPGTTPTVAGAAARHPAPRPGAGLPPWLQQPNYGDPNLISQAQAQTQAQIDPLLRYIANTYNARMTASSQAISGLSGQYASFLGQFAGMTNEAYDQAKAPISGAARGINAQLTSIGQQNAARENAAMASAGLPKGAAESPDINLAKEGKGAGGAAGAIGQALIDSLTTAQKAAMEYAGSLPTFAQQEGEYQKRITLAHLSAEMTDQLAQTTAEAPQMFWTIYNNLLDRAEHDREFAFQVRQYNDAQAQQRAGVTGPRAPTVAGRTSYWQGVAEKRTANEGQEWMGTSTGIRPVDADPTRPGIQPKYTLQGMSAQRLGIKTNAQIAAERRRAEIAQQNANTSRKNAQTSATRAAETTRHNRATESQAAVRERQRHAETLRRLQVAGENARTAEARAAVARRRAAETERHNRAMERIQRTRAASTGATRRAWNSAPKQPPTP